MIMVAIVAGLVILFVTLIAKRYQPQKPLKIEPPKAELAIYEVRGFMKRRNNNTSTVTLLAQADFKLENKGLKDTTLKKCELGIEGIWGEIPTFLWQGNRILKAGHLNEYRIRKERTFLMQLHNIPEETPAEIVIEYTGNDTPLKYPVTLKRQF